MSLTRKKLQRIGNSTGLTLPPEVLGASGMARDEEVIIVAKPGVITIKRLDPDFDAMVAAADRFVASHPNAIEKLGQ
jgi:antitoxin component of MazEF toxin-antitoxin module